MTIDVYPAVIDGTYIDNVGGWEYPNCLSLANGNAYMILDLLGFKTAFPTWHYPVDAVLVATRSVFHLIDESQTRRVAEIRRICYLAKDLKATHIAFA